ncbi:MAG: hypothetical protein ACLP59_03970 [Bryobacteraceae bacterium]
MYYRAAGILAACIWTLSLSAQTASQPVPAPQQLPPLPQFTAPPQSDAKPLPPILRANAEAALRKLLKNRDLVDTGICSIPLLAAKIPDNLEPMPVARPPANYVDRMATVQLPAPPCEEKHP